MTQESIVQACTEYLADYYAPGWNPWANKPLPCEQCPRRSWCQWPINPWADYDCPNFPPP